MRCGFRARAAAFLFNLIFASGTVASTNAGDGLCQGIMAAARVDRSDASDVVRAVISDFARPTFTASIVNEADLILPTLALQALDAFRRQPYLPQASFERMGEILRTRSNANISHAEASALVGALIAPEHAEVPIRSLLKIGRIAYLRDLGDPPSEAPNFKTAVFPGVSDPASGLSAAPRSRTVPERRPRSVVLFGIPFQAWDPLMGKWVYALGTPFGAIPLEFNEEERETKLGIARFAGRPVVCSGLLDEFHEEFLLRSVLRLSSRGQKAPTFARYLERIHVSP